MLAILKKRLWLIIGLVALVALIAFPAMGLPRQWTLYLFLFFFYWCLANMWNLLAGYSGLVSLCQPAFIGIGGYSVVYFTWNGMPFWVGIIVGGIVAALFAAAITIPTFRLKGTFFAIGTLMIPEIMRIVFLLWKPINLPGYGGGAGYMIKGIGQISDAQLYWMVLALGVGSFLLVRWILKSKLGLGLAAIRDNDVSAASSGVNVSRLKLYVFAMSAFMTAVAGAVFYVDKGFIQPDTSFNVSWTIAIITATVIGGLGTVEGPIVGTVIAVVLQFLLARSPGISLLIQGGILIVILLIAPRGIVGSLKSASVFRSLAKMVRKPAR
jgi:branched-chain amino acid transport system permease protein